MRPRQIATLALCVPLVAVAQSPKTGVPQYEIAPPAGWVQPPPAFGAAYATGANASSGSEYLLVDRQARLDGAASLYSRFVVRPLNPAGVSSESQVSIVFDPERERDLLRIMVEKGPLVDGVSGQPSLTVDGLSFDRYAEPLRRFAAL